MWKIVRNALLNVYKNDFLRLSYFMHILHICLVLFKRCKISVILLEICAKANIQMLII